jgi:hypothetical protein
VGVFSIVSTPPGKRFGDRLRATLDGLLGLVGYEPRYNSRAYEVDGLPFAISHRSNETEECKNI